MPRNEIRRKEQRKYESGQNAKPSATTLAVMHVRRKNKRIGNRRKKKRKKQGAGPQPSLLRPAVIIP